jgi:hypothetical protein
MKKDLCNLRLLNKSWRDLVDHDLIWRELLHRSYGVTGSLDRSRFRSWKQRFIHADRLRWSFEKKSSKIVLSKNSRVAKDTCKGDEKFRWVTVVTENVFAGGRHYVEIRVTNLCENDQNTIKVGFGALEKCTNYTFNCPFGYSHGQYASPDRNSWTYLADGRVMARGVDTLLKGQQWAKNDRIGILLDFHAETIAFYRNGHLQAGLRLEFKGQLHVGVSLIGKCKVKLTNTSINAITP